MLEFGNRDFWMNFGTQKWAVWCVTCYFRYPQTFYTTIFLLEAPFDRENAKFLRDLNNIVMPKFYAESTEKHLESDFGPF